MIGFQGRSVDITERKNAEEKLKKNEYFLNNILESVEEGISVLDLDMNISHVNETLKKWYPENLPLEGEKCYKVFHNADKPCEPCPVIRSLESGNKESDIVSGLPGSQVEWVELFSYPIKDPISKKITGIVEFVRDITKRKKIELAINESEQKLQKANATKDKFFSIIAHDLRSPFNTLLGFAGLLNEEFDKYSIEQKKRFISIIYESIQNTLKLLDNLLQWSMSQRGVIVFNPEKINLYLKAKEICDSLKSSAENKSIKLINQLALNINIEADSNMLATIIRNLLSNAIKYTYKNGKITIKTFLVPDENNIQYMGISISDTGVGIPKEIQSSLFVVGETKSTKGTENEKGTGLGLILCKEFVEKHGGKIWVESEVEKGSTFYFTIPNK